MATAVKGDQFLPSAAVAVPATAGLAPIAGAAALIAALGQPLQPIAALGQSLQPEAGVTNAAFFPAYLRDAKKERRVWQGLEITFFSAAKMPDFVMNQIYHEKLMTALYHKIFKELMKANGAEVVYTGKRFKEEIEGLASEILPIAQKEGHEQFLNKACSLLYAYFDQPSFIEMKWDTGTVNKEILFLVLAVTQFFYLKQGMQNRQRVEFTKEDLKAFQVKHLGKTAGSMNCFDFAMLKTKEIYAKKFIFEEPALFTKFKRLGKPLTDEGRKQLEKVDPLCNLPFYFKAWDYCPVVVPEPGDLVVYFNEEYEPKHVAVYESEGVVLSKLGALNEYSYAHPLFNVHSTHGSRAAFFRRLNQTLAT
jgi:hypothetical protein